MGGDLRLVKTDTVGQKLHGWMFPKAGVRPAKLNTDVVCVVNRLIPKQHLVGEIARRVCNVCKEGCNIVIVVQGRNIENSIAGTYSDWD